MSINLRERAKYYVNKLIINGSYDLHIKYQFDEACKTMQHSLMEFEAELVKEHNDAAIKKQNGEKDETL